MKRALCCGGILVGAVLLSSSAAHAQAAASAGPSTDTLALSLSDAQRLALERNPAFLADRQEAEIARGELLEARVYNYNPEAEFDAPGAGGVGFGEYEGRLTQEIEIGGQRGLRIRAARRGLARADFGVRDAARSTLAEASTAFFGTLAANRRLELAEDVLSLNQRLLTATRAQLRAGDISALDANLVEIETGRARARVLAERREAIRAMLELKRLAALPPDQPLLLLDAALEAPPQALLNLDSLVALALDRRPDLAAGTAAVEEQQMRIRLARRAAIPNLSVGVIAMRDRSGDASRIGVGVAIPLPVWDRNQGIIAQRHATAEQARWQVRATELQIRTQVTGAYRAYLAATEEVRIYEEEVLRPARENQRLLDTAYRAGKIGLPELLLLRNQLLDAELGYWDAWLAQWDALIDLQAATATLSADAVFPTQGAP